MLSPTNSSIPKTSTQSLLSSENILVLFPNGQLQKGTCECKTFKDVRPTHEILLGLAQEIIERLTAGKPEDIYVTRIPDDMPLNGGKILLEVIAPTDIERDWASASLIDTQLAQGNVVCRLSATRGSYWSPKILVELL